MLGSITGKKPGTCLCANRGQESRLASGSGGHIQPSRIRSIERHSGECERNELTAFVLNPHITGSNLNQIRWRSKTHAHGVGRIASQLGVMPSCKLRHVSPTRTHDEGYSCRFVIRNQQVLKFLPRRSVISRIASPGRQGVI